MYDIYVGNYPSHYSEDDVLNLFEDFEGIVLQRCFKKKQKSFCFLTCIDEAQVLDVVKKMNKLAVEGRNLVVRAQDPDIQRIIEDTVEKVDTSDLHKPSDETTEKTSQQQVEASKIQDELCERFFRGCGNHSQQVDELSDTASSSTETASSLMFLDEWINSVDVSAARARLCYPKLPEVDSVIDDPLCPDPEVSCNSVKQYSLRSDPEFSDDVSCNLNEAEKKNSCNLTEAENSSQKPLDRLTERILSLSPMELDLIETSAIKTFCKAKIEAAQKSGVHSKQVQELSNTACSSTENLSLVSSALAMCSSLKNVDVETVSGQENEELEQVYVVNFPLKTSVQDLFKLFEKFEPVKIEMLCNEPRKDRKRTKALVSFSDFRNALYATITLDTTMYRGRIITVYDARSPPPFPL